jgi:Tat protein translocase TatB subunit
LTRCAECNSVFDAMLNVGMPELALILVVALVVLGPKQLPEIARMLGKAMAEFRKATSGLNQELENARAMLEEEARKASEPSPPPRVVSAAGTEPKSPPTVAEGAQEPPTGGPSPIV